MREKPNFDCNISKYLKFRKRKYYDIVSQKISIWILRSVIETSYELICNILHYFKNQSLELLHHLMTHLRTRTLHLTQLIYAQIVKRPRLSVCLVQVPANNYQLSHGEMWFPSVHKSPHVFDVFQIDHKHDGSQIFHTYKA